MEEVIATVDGGETRVARAGVEQTAGRAAFAHKHVRRLHGR